MHLPRAPRMAAFACLTAFAALGQQGATFRTTTRLVEVNVTARDNKGKPVAGLDRADFEIQDGGKRREIAFFRYDAVPVTTASSEPLPPDTYSNRNEPAEGRPWNVSALVLDSLNTPPQSGVWVHAQLMRYLQAMAPETRIAIFRMGGKLEVLHDFTSDNEALRERVRKASVGMPLQTEVPIDQLAIEAEEILKSMNDDPMVAAMLEQNLEVMMMANAAAQRNRLENSLAAMEALGKRLSLIPGRKNLIWITGGFSMLSITGNMGFGPRGNIESYEGKVRATSQRLAQDGVTLYIVDAGLLEPPAIADAGAKVSSAPPGRGRFQPQVDTANLSADPRSTMQTMASITGGRYLYNTNDMMRGFLDAADDLRGSYTLGFYSSDADEKWHKLKVKIARPGISLRHREGYIAESTPADNGPDAWRKTALNGFGSSSIPITVNCKAVTEGVAVDILVNAASIEFHKEGEQMVALLHIVFADRGDDGSSREMTVQASVRLSERELEQVRVKGVRYTRTWKPEEKVFQTRIVVRDRQSGKYGSVDLPVRKILAGLKTGG